MEERGRFQTKFTKTVNFLAHADLQSVFAFGILLNSYVLVDINLVLLLTKGQGYRLFVTCVA